MEQDDESVLSDGSVVDITSKRNDDIDDEKGSEHQRYLDAVTQNAGSVTARIGARGIALPAITCRHRRSCITGCSEDESTSCGHICNHFGSRRAYSILTALHSHCSVGCDMHEQLASSSHTESSHQAPLRVPRHHQVAVVNVVATSARVKLMNRAMRRSSASFVQPTTISIAITNAATPSIRTQCLINLSTLQ